MKNHYGSINTRFFPFSVIKPFFLVLLVLFFSSILIPKGQDVLLINGHHSHLPDQFFAQHFLVDVAAGTFSCYYKKNISEFQKKMLQFISRFNFPDWFLKRKYISRIKVCMRSRLQKKSFIRGKPKQPPGKSKR